MKIPPTFPPLPNEDVATNLLMLPAPPTQVYPLANDAVNAPLTNKPVGSIVADVWIEVLPFAVV